MSFKNVPLIESIMSRLNQVDHLENHHINGDFAGARHAIDTLNAGHDAVRGQKTDAQVITDYNGGPSIVFGRHPTSGRFFVASKQNFNRGVNYTDGDIDANHTGDIADKMKTALHELPRVTPPEGMYQGDVLYTPEDLTYDGKLLQFKPDQITYSAHEAGPNGMKIKTSKIGLTVHTKYEGDSLNDMSPTYDVDHNNFGENSRVHIINPTVDLKKIHHSPKNQRAFQKHITEAGIIASDMDYTHHDKHRDTLRVHANEQATKGDKPSSASYFNWLVKKGGGVLDEAVKGSTKKYLTLAKDVEANKPAFDATFKLYHHLQQAKHAIIDSLSSYTEFAHSVGKDQTKPDGFVVVVGGKPSKFVNRYENQRQNSLMRSHRKKPDEPDFD